MRGNMSRGIPSPLAVLNDAELWPRIGHPSPGACALAGCRATCADKGGRQWSFGRRGGQVNEHQAVPDGWMGRDFSMEEGIFSSPADAMSQHRPQCARVAYKRHVAYAVVARARRRL